MSTDFRRLSPTDAGAAEDAPTAIRAQSLLPALLEIARGERRWLLVLIPFLTLVVIQASLLPGLWKLDDDAQSFQPFAILLFLYLAFHDRERVQASYTYLAEMYPPESRARRGSPVVVYLGCLILLASYISTMATVAAIGFIVTVAGIILYLYGFTILRVIARSMILLIPAIPLPGGVASIATTQIQIVSATLAAPLLKCFHHEAYSVGNFVNFGSTTVQIYGACGGGGVLLSVIVLTLFVTLLHGTRPTMMCILLGSAAVIAMTLNSIRIVLIALLASSNGSAAVAVHNANWCFIAIPTMALVLWAERPAEQWIKRLGTGAE